MDAFPHNSAIAVPRADRPWVRIAVGASALCGYAVGGVLLILGAPWIGVALAAGMTVVLWLVMCLRRPDLAFTATVFVWILAYARLSLQVVDLAGAGTSNRGALAVADLMWFGLLIALLLRPQTWEVNLRPLGNAYSWAMAPYLLAAVTLPFVGVAAGGWPAGFASPAVRYLQWASFVPIAFIVASQYGGDRLLRRFFVTLVIAGALHAAYGLLQLAVQLDWLGPAWLALDDLHARHNDVTWFFFGRVTGLLVNPNHYGLFAVFLLVAAVSWIIGGTQRHRALAWFAIAAAVLPVLLTGSRSAIVAIAAVSVFWLAIALAGDSAAVRLLRFVPVLLGLAAVTGIAVWRIVPTVLQNRYRRLLAVFVEGTGAEQNLTLRLEMWSDAWRTFLGDYPVGTWVAPSHALGMAIDSYYVFTAVQGTPLLTGVWLITMGSLFILGLSFYRRRGTPVSTAAGLMLCGWTITILVSSLTMSPLLQIHLSIPLWSLTGIMMLMRYDFGRDAHAHT
jgi:hypothetical protein